jgi:hypothetical protein
MTLTPEYDHAKDDVLTPLAAVDGKVDGILEDTSTSIPTSIAELPTDADVQTAARAALDDYAPTTWRDIPTDAEIQAAAQAAIVAEPATLTAAYDHAKDDVLTPLAAVDGKVDAILAEDVGADLGTDVCTITLRDEGGNAVADARVYVSSDAAGLVRSDIRVTNALGQVAFDLTAGNTYYLWAFSTLVDFTAANPMSFVAAAD